MSEIGDLAMTARAWPFDEARKLLQRIQGRSPDKGHVLFETGYGPSGLPHIGTFGEVVRTTMVRHAFETMSETPTRLFAFSDDMDGLRKVPDNIPAREMLERYVQKDVPGGVPLGGVSLTSIPDPFGTHDSFGAHNNARLKAFLDEFGFDYEFQSATEWYKNGWFDPVLLKVLERYKEIINVVLPTLGEERRKTYCPFLPISPKSGRVLHAPAEEISVKDGTIVFRDEEGERFKTPVTGGHCKLQWRVDWAMRWVALGVDYEMSGKDLIDSVRLSSEIARLLGGTPPEGFTYELFLDENGEKISKSRGNGLTVEEWLRYATPESLSLFMYQAPRKAKRLYFDVIPRHVDDYLTFLEAFEEQDAAKRLGNPVWHIHRGRPPRAEAHLSPRTRQCCGGSSRAMPRKRRLRPRPSSTAWWATPSTITATS
jgi:lysyl-tRNA synthetase class 1